MLVYVHVVITKACRILTAIAENWQEILILEEEKSLKDLSKWGSWQPI
jgi:hypothetical protein